MTWLTLKSETIKGLSKRKKWEGGDKKDHTGISKNVEANWKKKMNGGESKIQTTTRRRGKTSILVALFTATLIIPGTAPKQEKLAALVIESRDNNNNEYPTQMNPLKLLNAISM
ncbi:unnamed protein product, partial [Ilex paraguariensis]